MSFLVLGGTPASRDLAVRLQHAGIPVTCALLGADPRHVPLPPVEVVGGGFGGIHGMVDFLTARRVRGVIDASHPFAADVARDALAATTAAGVPMARLVPPSWEAQGGSPQWRWADDHRDALRIAERMGADRPFLSVGRESLSIYTVWRDRFVLARVVEPPRWPLPPRWEVIRSAYAPSYAAEFALLTSRRIDTMVTRDIGGALDEPSLLVAEALGIFVVMVRRPALPAGLRVLQGVDDAFSWVARRWRPQDFGSPAGRDS